MNSLIPIPKIDVSVRDATLEDVAFIDQLQKASPRQVGFMCMSWIEEKIRKGQIIVAEDETRTRIGYCMGVDRYFKRDEVGIVHQLNIVPGRRRSFVGATLLRAMFERSAYGVRLFCCWCAQDIEANRFWESMGFVPLAYRAGSAKKDRVHIFWQKRIREGDTTTPWWFPAKTDGGAIREDRIVLPIPMGMHWSDEFPRILPTEKAPKLPAPKKNVGTNGALKATIRPGATVQFGPPPGVAIVKEVHVEPKPAAEKLPKETKTCDPRLIAMARELRDRCLEQINSGEMLIESRGKYELNCVEQAPPNGRWHLSATAKSLAA